MNLKSICVVNSISPEEFRAEFYNKNIPVIIKDLAKSWPAHQNWNWEYLKMGVGDKKVGIYNNVKSDAHTPINKADEYKYFGEYIDMISAGPAEWRVFLFNIFDHAPVFTKDFVWPDKYMKGFVKKYPMLFTGGKGAITHMHFDIDLSHILHTQFVGRKRVLLFPYTEKDKLYRKPFEVLSLADFSRYYEDSGMPDYEKFPAIRNASGYENILEHGDTLFMPAGFWHHMEYLESGFALSLRALQPSLSGKMKGVWNLLGMRSIDTIMKKVVPKFWYQRKERKVFRNAAKEELKSA